VTSIFVECWGSGSNGGGSALGTGDGGGGGSYARSAAFAVTPGNPYGVQWGPGGTNVATLFDAGADVKAVPCVTSRIGANGVVNNVGAVKTNGGDGSPGQYLDILTVYTSNGGGSSAGRAANGGNGTRPTGGSVAGGGNGGDGGNPGEAGFNPTTSATSGAAAGPGPGGGGGGVGWNIFQGGIGGGAGGEGGILIYNATNDPVFYAVPSLVIGKFGQAPSFPAPPYSPKSVPRAFVM
jgi:hypothetical protein